MTPDEWLENAEKAWYLPETADVNWLMRFPDAGVLPMIIALKALLELHKPVQALRLVGYNLEDAMACQGCSVHPEQWVGPWPCDTYKTIADVLKMTEDQ